MHIRSHGRASHHINFIPTVLSDTVGRALSKTQRESANQACQIAPAWPGQIWYSQYMSDPASSISRIDFESRSAVSPAAARGEAVPDRIACLRLSYQMQGFSERVAEFLIYSWRNNTNCSYYSVWPMRHHWCIKRNHNPTSTSSSSVF